MYRPPRPDMVPCLDDHRAGHDAGWRKCTWSTYVRCTVVVVAGRFLRLRLLHSFSIEKKESCRLIRRMGCDLAYQCLNSRHVTWLFSDVSDQILKHRAVMGCYLLVASSTVAVEPRTRFFFSSQARPTAHEKNGVAHNPRVPDQVCGFLLLHRVT